MTAAVTVRATELSNWADPARFPKAFGLSIKRHEVDRPESRKLASSNS